MNIRARALPRWWKSWSIGAGLVAAAWGVALVTPGADHVQAPFSVTTEVGEQGVGRNIAVTVTEIRRVGELSAGGWSADGNWVVVDLDVASVVSEYLVYLHSAEMRLDGVRYSASERPESLRSQGLSAGVPRSGSLAFELPADLDAGDAVLELALVRDTRLDSMIVVPFDLAELPFSADGEMRETGWSAP